MICYCYSARCATSSTSTKPVIKQVPMTQNNCPDCGSTLVWVKTNTYLGARRASSKKREESRKEYLG